jgi:hypothetical protein
MENMLADFDPALDPHGAECGTCHNPHTQSSAQEARLACVNCHADWKTRPFHTGPAHVDVGTQCVLCHEPHRARVDASDCLGCHRKVSARPDVSPALRDRLRSADPGAGGQAVPRDSRAASGAAPWPHHGRHTDLACIRCHATAEGHGPLAFASPAGCRDCHHSPGVRDAGCAPCHDAGGLGRRVELDVAIRAAGAAERVRTVGFDHDTHAALRCDECHGPGAARAVTGEVASCRSCHDDHHTASRDCGGCHRGSDLAAAHASLADPHVRCAACHDAGTAASVVPDRGFCLACHAGQSAHQLDSGRECSECHFLAPPHALRATLTAATGNP